VSVATLLQLAASGRFRIGNAELCSSLFQPLREDLHRNILFLINVNSATYVMDI